MPIQHIRFNAQTTIRTGPMGSGSYWHQVACGIPDSAQARMFGSSATPGFRICPECVAATPRGEGEEMPTSAVIHHRDVDAGAVMVNGAMRWASVLCGTPNSRFARTEAEAVTCRRCLHQLTGREPEPMIEGIEGEVFVCQCCDSHVPIGSRVEVNGDHVCQYCSDVHYTSCRDCNQVGHREELTTLRGRRGHYCGSCVNNYEQCYSCRTYRREYDVHQIRSADVLMCTGCSSFCDDCDAYVSNDDYYGDGQCNDCAGRPGGSNGGIRGYGHTHPTRWYGGPLPRTEKGQQGYYLGFELEITDRTGNAQGIHTWARDNQIEGFFDCKEDGSVSGFEIATQPFTPEYFETMMSDGKWDSFFAMLNTNHPLGNRSNQEAEGHGLHVHIGKMAFERDDLSLAAFCYLLGQDTHLERIGRRNPTGYCARVDKPVSVAIVHTKQERVAQYVNRHDVHGNRLPPKPNSNQPGRLAQAGNYAGRNAINLQPPATVEIRAFRSTRSAQELANAVRLVYVAAEYVRWLRGGRDNGRRMISPRALHWEEFAKWVAVKFPEAFASIAGTDAISPPKTRRERAVIPGAGSYSVGDRDFDAVPLTPTRPTPRPGAVRRASRPFGSEPFGYGDLVTDPDGLIRTTTLPTAEMSGLSVLYESPVAAGETIEWQILDSATTEAVNFTDDFTVSINDTL